MRIISGNYKGKSIQYLKSKTTRPLKDSVKENIFNILKHSNKIDININSQKSIDIFRSYDRLLKKINEQK